MKETESKLEQKSINSFFNKKDKLANLMDIEDSVTNKQITPIKKKNNDISSYMKSNLEIEKKSPIKKNNEIIFDKNEKEYDMKTDYKNWLVNQKKKWSNLRKNNNYSSSNIKTPLRSLFNNKEQFVLNNTWHVLQVI